MKKPKAGYYMRCKFCPYKAECRRLGYIVEPEACSEAEGGL